MKSLLALLLALVSVSCGGAGPDGPKRLGEWRGDCSETAPEEYETVEMLAENPLDPKRATLDMLLAVPDFPAGLAERVTAAREENPSGTRWFGLLSPREREALRRFERFIELPGRPPVRIRGRLLRNRIGEGENERMDTYIAAGEERWSLRFRSRSSAGRHAVTPYCSRMLIGSSVNLCGGDFLPDFAMGLLFNGSFSSYPFSSGFPLRGYRWIIPAPSLSTDALRGAAVEVWSGRMRGILFAGRRRLYRGGAIRVMERTAWGGRGIMSVRSGEFGFSCCGGDDGFEPVRLGLDGRWRRGRLRAGFELASSGHDGAGLWCVSIDGRRGDAGFLVYRVPSGFGGRFGSVPGGSIGAASWQRGLVTVASCAASRRGILRASYERFSRGDAAGWDERETVRSEYEARWRRTSFRLSYRWHRRCRGRDVPFPSDDPPPPSESERLSLLFIKSWRRADRLRLSAVLASEDGGEGYLLAACMRHGMFGSRVRCTAATALFRSLRGEAVFSVYEPALEGSLPWRAVRGDGRRCVVLAEVLWRGVAVALRIAGGSSRDGELSVALCYNR